MVWIQLLKGECHDYRLMVRFHVTCMVYVGHGFHIVRDDESIYDCGVVYAFYIWGISTSACGFFKSVFRFYNREVVGKIAVVYDISPYRNQLFRREGLLIFYA